MNSPQTVAVLGASANTERYANMAVRRLRDAGHRVIPVNPALEQIEGLPVTKSLGDIAEPVDTLTLYVGPQRLAPLTEDILRLAPQRVIFNPGTESPDLAAVLDRVSNQLADTVAGEARGRADQARREDNRQRGLAEAGLGFPGDADAAQRQRERAEADARAAEDRRDRVRRQNDLRRELFERDAIAGQAGDEAQQAIRDRDEAQRRLDQAERAGDVAGANNARRDRDRAQGRLDRAFEDSPSGRTAAARADELDRREAARREQEDSIARGRELGRSPAERAGRELAQELRDLESAFDDNVKGILGRAGGRPQDAQADLDAARADFEADRKRLIEESLRQTAPAIFGLADQVANAVLQGPSRAALNATDVSTVEGSRELNRLLRGEDSARDQPLIELQREANKIAERIARGVENNEAKLAN
jgi:predicted CoA-binding protein